MTKNEVVKMSTPENRYFFSGMEKVMQEPDPKDVRILVPNQFNIYESLSFPRSLTTLYKVHGHVMPKSSVRRILYSLRDEGLIQKNNKMKWEQIKL